MPLPFQIIEPTLLLDEAKCRRNIQKMVEKAARNGVKLRPHFKTHQSYAVGQWFRQMGVDAITVSSLKMACYFAEDGWDDITVAFPVNTLEADRLNRLSKKIRLNVVIEDVETISRIDSILNYPANAFIKTDIGYHRTGVDAADTGTIDAMIEAFKQSNHLTLKGFLAHAGHSYNSRSHATIQKVHNESMEAIKALYNRYANLIPNLEISIGDTPTCSVCEGFGAATEIRPGNFVFYDTTQAAITSCTKDEIAVAIACPVVAKHKARNEIILYGGGVHFSKDVLDWGNGNRSYGDWVLFQENGWGDPVAGCYMSKLSQEHGTLKVTDEMFEQVSVGDVLLILPVHSCMTADLLGSFTTLDGNRFEMMDKRHNYL